MFVIRISYGPQKAGRGKNNLASTLGDEETTGPEMNLVSFRLNLNLYAERHFSALTGGV